MAEVQIEVREGESIEQALRRFNREVLRAGIIKELRRREFYEPPSVAKKRERKERERKIVRERKYAAR